MKLFAGLGNPGSEHAGNRHNVGFMALDRIAQTHDFPNWRKKYSGLVCDGEIAGERVLLLKPQTYMNESGRSVGEAARFLKIPLSDITVFYDEIDLAPGKLKAKTGGGNAGHNGLRSLSAHLGNDYARVRIGVGHPGQKHLVANYVLRDFSKSDADWLEPLLDAMAKDVRWLAKGDSARFLGAVAKTLAPDKPKQAEKKPDAKKAADTVRTSDAPAQQKAATPKTPDPPAPSGALAEKLAKWIKGSGG